MTAMPSEAEMLAGFDESDLVSVTNKRGKITHVSDSFAAITGYSREELLGQNHRMLKSGDQPQELFEDLWLTISKGKVWRGTIKNKTKNGTFIWLDTVITPVVDSSGKPVSYVSLREEVDKANSA